jgi:hypothetical protein
LEFLKRAEKLAMTAALSWHATCNCVLWDYGKRGWRTGTMDAQLKLEMMRVLSITAALASGLSLGVGAAIVAVLALLQ